MPLINKSHFAAKMAVGLLGVGASSRMIAERSERIKLAICADTYTPTSDPNETIPQVAKPEVMVITHDPVTLWPAVELNTPKEPWRGGNPKFHGRQSRRK